MYITQHSNITDLRTRDELWELYTVSYERLAAADITRETFFRSEFDEVLADPTNRVWVARDEGRPIAMTVIATDITRTRYLSRAYFDRVDPERMDAGLVHYLLWVVTHPDYQAGSATRELARGSLGVESSEGALLVFDLPDSNQPNAEGRGAELIRRYGQMVGPVTLQEHGVSRYYALDFELVDDQTAAEHVGAASGDAGRATT